MLKQKRAQAALFVVVGIVLFITISVLAHMTSNITAVTFQGVLQEQEQYFAEQKITDWQYRQAVQTALLDSLMELGEGNWQERSLQEAADFLKQELENELPQYINFATHEAEKPDVELKIHERFVEVDVYFPIKKERAGQVISQQTVSIAVPYQLPRALEQAQQWKKGGQLLNPTFQIEGNTLKDKSLWWRGDSMSYT